MEGEVKQWSVLGDVAATCGICASDFVLGGDLSRTERPTEQAIPMTWATKDP